MVARFFVVVVLAAVLCPAGVRAATPESESLLSEDIPADGIGRSSAPLHVFSREDLGRTGYTETSRVLEHLVPGLTFPLASTTDGSDHVRYVSFRGMAPDHVLVLVNGKRRHKSALLNVADTVARGSVGVDLNAIPTSAIERIEVLGAAASARYGTDAVAGVINIVLEDADHGGAIDVTYGQHRGPMKGVPRITGLFVNDAAGAIDLFEAGERSVDDGDGDTVTLSGSWGFELTENGYMRLAAEYRDREATNRSGYDIRQQYPLLAGGDFDPRERIVDRLNHRQGNPAVTDLNILFNAGVALTPSMELYGFTSFSGRHGESAALFRRPLDAANIPAIHPDGFLPIIESDIDDRALTVGLRGTVRGWSWDSSYSQGENEIDWSVENTLNASLGPTSPTRFATGNNESREQTIALTASRRLDLPVIDAPLDATVGVERRSVEFEVESGEPASFIDGGFVFADGRPAAVGAQGFPGFEARNLDEARDVTSAFTTVALEPVSSVDVSASLRFDDYSDIDSVVNAGVGVGFALGEQLMLRASAGTAHRAPSMAQAHYARSMIVFDGTTPEVDGIFPPGTAVARALGATPLEREDAIQLGAGAVFSPVRNVVVALDVYRIELDDRVVLSQRLNGPAVDAALANAGISGIGTARFFFNGVDTRTRGVDLSAAYTFDWQLGRTRLGAFRLRAALNASDTEITDVAATPPVLTTLDPDVAWFTDRERTRIEEGTPDSKLILSARWQRDRFSGTLRASRYGETTSPATDRVIDAEWLIDLALTYRPTPVIGLSVGMNNALNAYPDAAPIGGTAPALNRVLPYPSVSPFGFNGRYMYARVTARFE